jgi:hypothetical protein
MDHDYETRRYLFQFADFSVSENLYLETQGIKKTLFRWIFESTVFKQNTYYQKISYLSSSFLIPAQKGCSL